MLETHPDAFNVWYKHGTHLSRRPDRKRQDYSEKRLGFIHKRPSQSSIDDLGLNLYQLTASRFYTERV